MVCVKLPLAPCMVIGYVPGAVLAEVASVRIETPEPVTDAGLNDARTPAGMPLAVRFTAPLKPLSAATPMVELAELPTVALTDPGVADSVKSDDPFTVNVTVVVRVKLPPTPCMEIGYVPGVVFAEAVSVRMETPEPVTEEGLNDTRTPKGMPLAVRFTASPNPLSAATPIVELA